MSKNFYYEPGEHEAERASNSYLMSLVAVIAGLPLPILNLIASVIFFMGNRKGSYFVRWHCTHVLLSQVSLLFVNSAGFWWTTHIIFDNDIVTNEYIAYMITLFVFNATEFIATIYAAMVTRKGKHIEWWFYGGLTNAVCKP